MHVGRGARAVFRRWYVFLSLVALTVFGALWVGDGVHPQYESTAIAILVPGSAPSDVSSPYGDIRDTNHVLSIVLTTVEARESIAELGLVPDYKIDAREGSTLLNVEVVSDTLQGSLDTGEAVLELAREELAQRQLAAGIPPDAQIGLQVLQAPADWDVVTEGKTRNMAIVGLVGAALSLLVTVLFDDLVRWLRRTRPTSGHETRS